jgi:hypothetical protein
MKNRKIINGFEIDKKRIEAHTFLITVFESEKNNFQFRVSLQPNGEENSLPSFKLVNEKEKVPNWIHKHLSEISNWIKSDY